jgi:hypothetical protein
MLALALCLLRHRARAEQSSLAAAARVSTPSLTRAVVHSISALLIFGLIFLALLAGIAGATRERLMAPVRWGLRQRPAARAAAS